MNRRWFLKSLAGAGAAVVLSEELIEALKPKSTIFLPPRFGWHPSMPGDGCMREVEQYIINRDEMSYRYDAVGRDIWGNEQQCWVHMIAPDPALARIAIADRFKQEGLIAIRPADAKIFRLKLPRVVENARYV